MEKSKRVQKVSSIDLVNCVYPRLQRQLSPENKTVSLKLLIRFPWNVKQSELSLIRFFFRADSIRKEPKVFPVYMVNDEICFYICLCVVSVHSCEMQTHVQIQSQGNETFFISCVGACVCVCICFDVVHRCIFLRLHLRRTCEPSLK